MKSFDNKVAVVTGAASGMGRYLAVLLAKMGCNVAICDVNKEELSKTSVMLANYNVATSEHVVDIGDKAEIERFHEEVMARHQKLIWSLTMRASRSCLISIACQRRTGIA